MSPPATQHSSSMLAEVSPADRPLRILYDHAIFTRQAHGGFSRYYTELISRIAADPCVRVSLFMGLHISGYDLDQHSDRFERFFGVRRPISRGTYRLTANVNRWFFSRFAQKCAADLIHETAYLNLPVPGAKRIVTLHDLVPERMPHLRIPIDSMFAKKRESVLNADGVICISERTRQDMLELYGQPRGKVVVIHHANSLVLPVSDCPPVSFPYILFVGSRGTYKNFTVLLEAYGQSQMLRKAVQLVCFGGGPFRDDEFQRIARLGLANQVHWFTGPDRLLVNLYAHAKAFVYPSLYEGFGIPLLEAMHYGCPVVASRASCFPEIAGEAAEYFEPTSTEHLRAKLITVLDDPCLRDRMIQKGHEHELMFNWDRCAKETVNFYRLVNSQ